MCPNCKQTLEDCCDDCHATVMPKYYKQVADNLAKLLEDPCYTWDDALIEKIRKVVIGKLEYAEQVDKEDWSEAKAEVNEPYWTQEFREKVEQLLEIDERQFRRIVEKYDNRNQNTK